MVHPGWVQTELGEAQAGMVRQLLFSNRFFKNYLQLGYLLDLWTVQLPTYLFEAGLDLNY